MIDNNTDRIKGILMRQIEILSEVVEDIHAGRIPEWSAPNQNEAEHNRAKSIEQVCSMVAHVAGAYAKFL